MSLAFLLTVYGFCFVLMILVAIVAIPSDVRALILENCKNSSGKFRTRYIVKELGSLSRFYGEMLFAAGMLAIVLTFGLIVLDDYVKLDIIHNAAMQASLDFNEWEQNLRSSPNNVEQQFTRYHLSQGGDVDSARRLMRFLWGIVPIMLLLSFTGLLASMRLSSRVFNHALKSLVDDEVRRNRRRIKQRYLRSTSTTATSS